MTFKITKDVWPSVEEEINIVLPNDQGVLKYKDIDLTEVGKIKIRMTVAPNYFSGGKLELYIDDENGQKIGAGDLEVGLTDLGFKALVIVIGDTKGTHDLVLNDILQGPKQDIWWHRNLGV